MAQERWRHTLRRRLAQRILGNLPLNATPTELDPITPEQLAQIQRLFQRPKFFIMGYPRSGTTLLMRLIRLHPRVHCNRQAHFFTHPIDATHYFADAEIRQWLGQRSNRWTRDESLEAVLVRLVADFILEQAAQALGKDVVGDKSPNTNHGLAVQRMHAVYPDGRLIFIIRDGRDAVLSHRFMQFIDQEHYLRRQDLRIKRDFAHDSRPFFDRTRSVFTPQAIRQMARDWAQNVTETHQLGLERYGPRYMHLRYEDLLDTPLVCMQQVWEFLDVNPDFPDYAAKLHTELEINPSVAWHRHKEAALVQDLPRGQPGAWQSLFTHRDREIFKEETGQALIHWGYAQDLGW